MKCKGCMELEARVAVLEKELAEEKEYARDLKHNLDVAQGCVDSDEYNEALRAAKEENMRTGYKSDLTGGEG